jgi:transglutaminase-like putative cysteine protease
MMNLNKILPVIFLLFCLSSFAQKLELGDVTVDELKERRHPKDSAAAAAILFQKGKISYVSGTGGGLSMVVEVSVKIKIYKKEGYEWANKEIYYNLGRGQSMDLIKATTYNLVNNQIEKTELKSNGEFTEKINKSWRVRKITMPNVKEGTIIEFKYKLESWGYSSIPDWMFQADIPVNYSEYNVAIPEYYNYIVHKKGNLPIRQTSQKTNGRSGMGTRSRQFIVTTTQYVAENVPALKDESYVDNIRNYLLSIEFELVSRQLPYSDFELFSTDWEIVSKSILEEEFFGPELDKKKYFEKDLSILLEGVTLRDEKIAVVFNYVKSRMKWNGYADYSCDDGVTHAYKEKTGNSAEINLMLVAMLRYAGIDASPIVLSTRSHGIALYPSKSAFNYVIAAVEIPDDIILLDATSKNALPNILPIRDLNWTGRIIRKEGSSAEIELNAKFVSKGYTNLMANISPTGDVEGKIKIQNFDYNGFLYREVRENKGEEAYLEELEKELKNSIIEEYVIENRTETDKPVIETFSFKNSSSVEVIGNKMYFSPLMIFAQTESPFIQENREYPIDFVYPIQEKYLTIINIPEGYVVESMPAPVAIVFTDELLSYKFNISSNGKQIQVSSVFDIKTNMLASDDYEELKKFFAEMIKKQTEKVVLKKA